MKINDIKSYEKTSRKPLPKDEMSEGGVIGSILMNPEYMLKTDYLQAKMFYYREHGVIWHVISEFYKKGIIEIDNFMIISEIQSNKGFKNIIEESEVEDIEEWINGLKEIGRNTFNEFEILARKVATTSFQREAHVKLVKLSEEVISTESDVNDINYKLTQDINDFSKTYISNKEIKLLSEQVDEIWDNILQNRNGGMYGYPVFIQSINDWFTLERTELYCINSPGKTGKSQFLANQAWYLAAQGIPTMYYDKEMSTDNHMIRMLSHFTGIQSTKIKVGDLTINEEKLVKEQLGKLKKLPYIHVYKPVTQDLNEIYMNIKSAQLKHGIDFLVWDYIKANAGGDSDKEYQVLGRQVDWLKNNIAGDLDLSVLTASQAKNDGGVADSSKILRSVSLLANMFRKTKDEIVEDGGIAQSGNLKFQIIASRHGRMHEEDEYLNLYLDGDVSTIRQPKITSRTGEILPY